MIILIVDLLICSLVYKMSEKLEHINSFSQSQ